MLKLQTDPTQALIIPLTTTIHKLLSDRSRVISLYIHVHSVISTDMNHMCPFITSRRSKFYPNPRGPDSAAAVVVESSAAI